MSDTPETDHLENNLGKAAEMSHPTLWAFARELERKLNEARREAKRWRAAHDNQVKLKQIISDRPDLKERAKLVAELIEERDGWREAAYSLGEAIPASWEELQPPAEQLRKFKEMVKLQQEKYNL